jgi:hypothetical protein
MFFHPVGMVDGGGARCTVHGARGTGHGGTGVLLLCLSTRLRPNSYSYSYSYSYSNSCLIDRCGWGGGAFLAPFPGADLGIGDPWVAFDDGPGGHWMDTTHGYVLSSRWDGGWGRCTGHGARGTGHGARYAMRGARYAMHGARGEGHD